MSRLALCSALSLVVVLGTSLASRDASAFCRTRTQPSAIDDCASQGPSLYWRNRCVGFTVATAASKKANLDKARAIVASSFAAWLGKNATCTPGIQAVELEPTKTASIGFNRKGANENVVVFRDDAWPYDDAGNPLALTTVTFNADTGEILDADIEVNTADRGVTAQEPLPAQGYDLQSIITHEVGHYLGLAHTKVNNATMESRYDRGQTGLRTLEPDDQKGSCTIYPSEAEHTTDKPGEAAATRLTAGPCQPVITVNTEEPAEDTGCACAAAGSGQTTGLAKAGFFATFVAFAAIAARRSRRRQGP